MGRVAQNRGRDDDGIRSSHLRRSPFFFYRIAFPELGSAESEMTWPAGVLCCIRHARSTAFRRAHRLLHHPVLKFVEQSGRHGYGK